ncbi:hypothetical protein L7F22_061493 [Adiantum nelumboides]|nr:hypothetical protein [Adiantum nelumboides]
MVPCMFSGRFSYTSIQPNDIVAVRASPAPSTSSCPSLCVRASLSSPYPSPSPSDTSAPTWTPTSVGHVRFSDGSPTEFSPYICGCYSLAGGHGYIYERDFTDAMELYARAGFSTFDTADIYGPSEGICGKFLANWKSMKENSPNLSQVHIFTKYVPNVFSNKPNYAYVERSVRKSLNEIGVSKLDLVQLHWWDYSMRGMLDVALALTELREKGLITSIGTTNMSTEALSKIVDAGVPVVSNQVQFSLLDRRPLRQMLPYCKERDIKLFAYGPLTGGVLTNRYLSSQLVLKTSSLRMYSRILKEAGGEKYWRKLLGVLSDVAKRKAVSIATISLRWVLQQGPFYPIVGMTSGDHYNDNLKAFSVSLDEADLAQINEILQESKGPKGDCYELERNMF